MASSEETLDLTAEEVVAMKAYPGGFCCGDCPFAVQCPWRFCQCCAGISTLCCLYAPVFFFLWLLSCCHGCCCNMCCPTVEGDAPQQYTRKSSLPTKMCFRPHYRRFLGCLTIRLLNVPQSKRGCCWRCWHHFICCIASVDTHSRGNTMPEYVQTMRNDFGDTFPMSGGMALCDYEEGVELIAGTDACRDDGAIFVGDVNSVLKECLAAGSISISTSDPKFQPRRKMTAMFFQDIWERARRMGHDIEASGRFTDVKESGAEIRAKIESIIASGSRKNVFSVVIKIIFYMFTGGDLSDEEARVAAKASSYSFLDDRTLFLLGGYYNLYKVADAAKVLNRAILRHPSFCNPVIRACREADEPPVNTLRGVSIAVLGAGGLGTSELVNFTLNVIDSNPSKYNPLFDANPFGFVQEVERTRPAVPFLCQKSMKERSFWSGGREVTISPGDWVMVPFVGVNTSMSMTGTVEMGLSEENITQMESEPQDFERMLSWNGVNSEFARPDFMSSDVSPRNCPGRNVAIPLVVMMVQHFKRGQ